MTKERLNYIFKRLPYIYKMLRQNKLECCFYISNRKEKIIIDDIVLVVLDIIEEIIDKEKTPWVKKIITEIKRGESDIKIIQNNPIERTKFYAVKKSLKEKIYQCCICKKIVKYSSILTSKID